MAKTIKTKRKILVLILAVLLESAAVVGLALWSVRDQFAKSSTGGSDGDTTVTAPDDSTTEPDETDGKGDITELGEDDGKENDTIEPVKSAGTEGLAYTLSSDKTYYICSGMGTCEETEIEIAPSYNEKRVTEIGYQAFYKCTSLTNITIPDSVTSIESKAFYWCTGLKSVTIPDSVTSIGSWAFYVCISLTSIVIPDGVTSIGYEAFCGCTKLTSITIPGSVTSIGRDVFDSTAYYKDSDNWEDGVLYIGNHLIEAETAIEGIYSVKAGTLSIASDAFYYCTGLTSITIPDSVTSIGSCAFMGCSNLTYNEYDNAYYLGNSVNPYVVLIKAKSTDITSCSIHKDAKVIYYQAFQYCTSLTSITIPDSVTSIGNYAFRGCSAGLESITVSSGNTVYHSAENCLIETASKTLILGCKNSVIPTDGSVISIGSCAFYECIGLTSITVPSSVTTIGSFAFLGCSSLTNITIPDNVTTIGNYAFQGCSGLESITVSSGNTVYHSAGNCLIETASKTLLLDCKNSVIPTDGSVASIGNCAFYECSGLTSVTIPDSVTSIGGNAFAWCTSLTSITIPGSVTSIGWDAFYASTRLTSITFEGTMEEWKAITKDSIWRQGAAIASVVCSDGTLTGDDIG